MTQERTFGRRAPRPAPSPPPRVPPAALPTLKDIGFTPSDAAELRTFRQGYRHRRFIGRGGWRWAGGVSLGIGSLAGLLGLEPLRWLFAAAGVAAILYSFSRHARSPEALAPPGPAPADPPPGA